MNQADKTRVRAHRFILTLRAGPPWAGAIQRAPTPGAPAGAATAPASRKPAAQQLPALLRRRALPGVDIVSRSRVQAALLVDSSRQALQKLLLLDPALAFYEEHWYRVARAGAPVVRIRAARRSGAGSAAARAFTVRVVLDDAHRTPLPNVRVTALLNPATGRGDDAHSDRNGRARLLLPASAKTIALLDLDPQHGAWQRRLENVAVGDVEIALAPIDLAAADARGLIYGAQSLLPAGLVHVAVIDTGVGPHKDLVVHAARDMTVGGAHRNASDADGHGTHVAGVIAATAAGWRRGEAAGVALHAYRVFAKGEDMASNFAIGDAIVQAAMDGCDLINLSLGSEDADPYIQRAVVAAWQAGSVCIAASGNEGKARVDYPARYSQAIAVSAMGLAGAWPAGAAQEASAARHRGKRLNGKESFFAEFSNWGRKVALTAPGVGIVSTIPGDRWGVMDGTSMAAPIATGVIARRLAAVPDFLAMPRDAQRARRIRELALAAAEDIRLPAAMQGRGLAR